MSPINTLRHCLVAARKHPFRIGRNHLQRFCFPRRGWPCPSARPLKVWVLPTQLLVHSVLESCTQYRPTLNLYRTVRGSSSRGAEQLTTHLSRQVSNRTTLHACTPLNLSIGQWWLARDLTHCDAPSHPKRMKAAAAPSTHPHKHMQPHPIHGGSAPRACPSRARAHAITQQGARQAAADTPPLSRTTKKLVSRAQAADWCQAWSWSGLRELLPLWPSFTQRCNGGFRDAVMGIWAPSAAWAGADWAMSSLLRLLRTCPPPRRRFCMAAMSGLLAMLTCTPVCVCVCVCVCVKIWR